MSTQFEGRRWRATLALFAAAALALVGFAGRAPAAAAAAQAPLPAAGAGPSGPVTAVPSYADVVERVAPTVVTIRTVQLLRADAPGNPFERLFRPGDSPEPPAQRSGGLGSGVIVSPDGYVLTNHHVVEGAQSIAVELSDRRQLQATLVGSDPPSDLAVLKLDASGLSSLPLGDSSEVRVGDVVLAFGNPLGVGQTVTSGIISARGRAMGVGDGSYEDFLQTDAAINRGNSGGPLVSLRGELIGINTQILSQSGGNIGIGFAIPSDMAADVMRQLVAQGRVERGRLGVTAQGITSDLAASLELGAVRGALINQVDTGGPAARAGLRRGDVVISLDGAPVGDANDLRNRVARHAPGSRVQLEVLRDGQSQRLEATLAEMDAGGAPGSPAPSGPGRGRYGMEVAPLTPEQAHQLGIEAGRGVVVAAVDPAGPAAAAGIQRGDVIEEVERRPVADVDSLKAALEAAGERPALVLINRRGTTLFLTLSR